MDLIIWEMVYAQMDGTQNNWCSDMRTYLSELSDEDKLRSRDSQTSYTEGFSEEFTYAHRCALSAIALNEFCDQTFDRFI